MEVSRELLSKVWQVPSAPMKLSAPLYLQGRDRRNKCGVRCSQLECNTLTRVWGGLLEIVASLASLPFLEQTLASLSPFLSTKVPHFKVLLRAVACSVQVLVPNSPLG